MLRHGEGGVNRVGKRVASGGFGGAGWALGGYVAVYLATQ